MTTVRYGAWPLLALAILADVAPNPSGSGCNGSSESRGDSFLELAASDCSCAPGEIRVSIDGRYVATLTCGPTEKISVQVSPGSHTVSAQSPTATWSPREQIVVVGRSTAVELGCPSRY